MKHSDDGLGCLMGLLWIIFLPFEILKELLKNTK